MALIAMAVHDTVENGKTKYTKRCLNFLIGQLRPFDKVYIINNNSCESTRSFLEHHFENYNQFFIIHLSENIGTAKAINMAWIQRDQGEHCVKIDNDIIIHDPSWLDKLEACLDRDPSIGQIGLKRKDCIETPWRTDNFKSELYMLPHEPGQPWIITERSAHVMGSCVMHSSALLDKIGYLYQPGLYGWDDVLMSHRANAAGFKTCFLSHIEIDHIDPGGNAYNDWKHKESGKDMALINSLIKGYHSGTISTYYGPHGEHE